MQLLSKPRSSSSKRILDMVSLDRRPKVPAKRIDFAVDYTSYFCMLFWLAALGSCMHWVIVGSHHLDMWGSWYINALDTCLHVHSGPTFPAVHGRADKQSSDSWRDKQGYRHTLRPIRESHKEPKRYRTRWYKFEGTIRLLRNLLSIATAIAIKT